MNQIEKRKKNFKELSEIVTNFAELSFFLIHLIFTFFFKTQINQQKG